MKKVYFIIVLILIAFPQLLFSQNFRWMKQIGGTSNELVTDIEIDKSQNLVYTGTTFGPVDLNPGTPVFMVYGSSNESKAFVCKSDSNGNSIWIDTFGGTGRVYSQALTTDYANNIYITGFFKGTIDFDPSSQVQQYTSNASLSSIFFLKLDANGNLIWINVLDGNAANLNQGFDIIVSKEYGVYLSGTFGNGNIDFDPSAGQYLLMAPVRHIFVAKYGYDGNLIWAKSYGGDGPEESCVMESDEVGNIYLTGQFSSNCDFDPGPNVVSPYPNSSEKLYVTKWDKNGNFKWVRCWVGTGGSCWSNDIDYDLKGNLYVCGQFGGTMDFDDKGEGGIMTSYQFSTFALKMDTSGAYNWSFKIDSSGAYNGYIDKHDKYYIAGFYFKPNVDFDPGSNINYLPFTGNNAGYIAKYSDSGTYIWAKGIIGNYIARTSSLELDSLGQIYCSGEFNQTADFNPGTATYNATSSGADDVYLLKLSQCYLNPLVQLNNKTLTSLATNVSYQWFNCATGQIVSGATNVSFTPTQTGTYAVAINNGSGCVDTSQCFYVEIPIVNGVNNVALNNQLLIYPNPGHGAYVLEMMDGQRIEAISIVDILGKEIATFKAQGSKVSFELDVNSGIYFIKVKMASGAIGIKRLIHQQ